MNAMDSVVSTCLFVTVLLKLKDGLLTLGAGDTEAVSGSLKVE